MREAALPDRNTAALAYARGENVVDPRPLRLTVEDFERLDQVWRATDHHHSTELIDGVIYHTPARYALRAYATMELYVRLREALEGIGSELAAYARGAFVSPPYDLLLPDVLVVLDAKDCDFFPAESVRLAVEVAQSATGFFLGDKLRAYARSGVLEYWVADVDKHVIHQMWAPGGDGYAEQDEVRFGERIAAATIAGLAVETSGL